MKLHWQILIALALAVLAGALASANGPAVAVFHYIGELFLNALKMLIVPLIVAAIVSSLADLGGGDLGRLGIKTLVYYFTTSVAAVITGVLLVDIIHPGILHGAPAGGQLGLAANTTSVVSRVQGHGLGDIAGVVTQLVPPNIVHAASEGQMLGLIFFSILFGFFITRLPGELQASQRSFWQGFYQVMIGITNLVIRFAPIGVFGLVAAVVARTGWNALPPLAWFFVTVLAALAVHMLITLPLLLRFAGGVSPVAHYRAMMPALLTAFSTSSSSATLPVTLECVQKRAGVSRRTASFVLPLGSTVNMDGTALYECVAALFIAQAYGLGLGPLEQFLVVFTALITSIGVAGIPSASLVAIAVILSTVGLPLEGVGLILAVDRVLDMCRTAVNVFSDSCGAVVIARREGETGVLQQQSAPHTDGAIAAEA